MSEKAAEFLVLFLVKLAAALVERRRQAIKGEEDKAAFDSRVDQAKLVRKRSEKQDAAGKIKDSF